MPTTFPLDKITDALDVLQEHGVLSNNTADHRLGEWLEENSLTDDDINNFRPEQASDDEMSELITCYTRLFESDPREAVIELAYLRTAGGRRDEVLSYTTEFKEMIAEMDGDDDEEPEEVLAESVLSKIRRILKDGFTTSQVKAIKEAFNEVFAKFGDGTTKEDTDSMLSDTLHQIIFTNDEIDVLDLMNDHPLETPEWKRVREMAYAC